MKFNAIVTFSFLFLISLNSYSQNKKEEIKHIKSFFYDLKPDSTFKKHFSIYADSFYLPKYFRSNKWLYGSLVSYKVFDTSNNDNISVLSKEELISLKSILLNDTIKLTLKKSWFSTKRVRLFSDQEINKGGEKFLGVTKPVFFRNYSLCLFTVYYIGGMSSTLYKYENGHWKFYNYFFGFER
jgi:hypothetical protein